jgi:hypothetical protein
LLATLYVNKIAQAALNATFINRYSLIT